MSATQSHYSCQDDASINGHDMLEVTQVHPTDDKETETAELGLYISGQDIPVPDGGYGWSYGVYLAYYLSHSTFQGARPLDFALVGGLNFGVCLIVAPLVTVLVRRYNLKVPMLMGTVFLGGGFISASFATQIWHLYLSQGALVGLGLGFTWIPSIAILPQWFSKRRSLANGITSAGSGVGGLLFSLATGPMISNISLAWSLRIIGIITFVMNLIATLLAKDRNAIVRPNQIGFDIELLRRMDVLLLLGWAFISMPGYMVLLYSLSDYALSIGLSQSQADHMTAFMNLGTAIGRPLIGALSDRLGRIEVAGSLTFFCSLWIFAVWIPSSSFAVTVLFSLVCGAIIGVFWPTIAPLSAEVAGLKEVPSLLSLAWLTVLMPTTFSEVAALYLRELNSSRPYLHPQIFSGLSYFVASLFLLQLWRMKRKKAKSVSSE
ncbi:putative mfs mcp solute carrier family 16 (monocarboxylic acid transporters) member 6 [Phaeomoniella chlamydospora]|uniref:Putative mfs mcp solute carrier family 16 (Monocarboxylic acid transporters) member 6 n=1 Tax=Phaeomoniella chlamydospora TaxID=158046 RepID=A0A0G2F2C4_PHACM|nr:putative mfs mcp solute carrier family 16 (monocarboxylic acid transporters) member 6 [Phaeomoniella chlamydospora]